MCSKYILIPQGAKVCWQIVFIEVFNIEHLSYWGKKINYIIIHLYVIKVIILNIILGGDVAINIKWSFEI